MLSWLSYFGGYGRAIAKTIDLQLSRVTAAYYTGSGQNDSGDETFHQSKDTALHQRGQSRQLDSVRRLRFGAVQSSPMTRSRRGIVILSFCVQPPGASGKKTV